MTNHPLRNVIAHGFQTIHTNGGYVSPTKNKERNTQTEVLASLKKNSLVDITYWNLADEVIDFFRTLPKNPEYKSIMARADGPEFQTCIDAVKDDEINHLTFMYAVLIPHLYSKLKPKLSKAPKLNPNSTVAKIIDPGEFMGTLNKADRFFVKLVFVGPEYPTKGTLFKVIDRSGNIGFFIDRAERFVNKIFLTDCFAMHATPSRHVPDEKTGEKHTIFRNIELIAGKTVPGKGSIDTSNDESKGKVFSKEALFD
jgi:hypothetical protein